MPIVIQEFYDAPSWNFSYVVWDDVSREAAIIDSVLGINVSTARINFEHANGIIDYVEQNNLKTKYILDTHVHADHLSGAPYLKEKLGGQLMIGKEITTVQEIFGKVFNEGTEFERDGSQFDILLTDGYEYNLGEIKVTAIHTPGHTPACYTHVYHCNTKKVFVGDTIFMPDSGTARCDFPGGDAGTLWDSMQKILSLPEDTAVYVCHDYQPGGREPRNMATVGEHLETNIHIKRGTIREEYIQRREA